MGKYLKKDLKKGELELICGPMFSRKTTYLIDKLKRLKKENTKTLFFRASKSYEREYRKNELEILGSGKVIKITSAATLNKKLKASPEIKTILIDEVQFFDKSFVDAIAELLTKGYKITIAGLDKNFRGVNFEVVEGLEKLATNVIKLKATCDDCKNPAEYSQKYINTKLADTTSPIFKVGGEDFYKPKCVDCFVKPVWDYDQALSILKDKWKQKRIEDLLKCELNKEDLKHILIEATKYWDYEYEVDLSDIDFGKCEINLSGIKAKYINNNYQKAEDIDNEYQEAEKWISNREQKAGNTVWNKGQKAGDSIGNDEQEAGSINNKDQKATRKIKNLFQEAESIDNQLQEAKKDIKNYKQKANHIDNKEQWAGKIDNSKQAEEKLETPKEKLLNKLAKLKLDKEDLKELLINNFTKGYIEKVDLSNIDFGRYSIDLSGIEASRIDNSNQRADVIKNGHQKAKESIFNEFQAAEEIINGYQEGEKKKW